MICSSRVTAGVGWTLATSSSRWVHAAATPCGRRQLTWASRDLDNGSMDFGRIVHSPGSLPLVKTIRDHVTQRHTLTQSRGGGHVKGWWCPEIMRCCNARCCRLGQRRGAPSHWRATVACTSAVPGSSCRRPPIGSIASEGPPAARLVRFVPPTHPPPVYSIAAAAPSGPRGVRAPQPPPSADERHQTFPSINAHTEARGGGGGQAGDTPAPRH